MRQKERTRRRLRWGKRIAALWALAGVLLPDEARSQETTWWGGVGAFFGYAFGAESGYEWGLHGFATVANMECGFETGYGPQLRLSSLDGTALFVAGGHVGAAAAGGWSASADLGLLASKHGVGIDLGLMPSHHYFLYGDLRYRSSVDAGFIGGGFGIPRHVAPSCYGVEGRPLRDDAGEPIQTTLEGPCTPQTEREQAAAIWARAAQDESDSVPSFLRLAEELVFHEAPDRLIGAALSAARDEIRHALNATRIAMKLDAGAPVPRLARLPPRTQLAGDAGLARLAVESVIDGMLGEGSAARRAQAATKAAPDPTIRSILLGVARDESRHAALGRTIAAWALGRSCQVRDAVADLRRLELAEQPEHTVPGLAQFGCGQPSDRRRALEWTVRRTRSQLEQMIAV